MASRSAGDSHHHEVRVQPHHWVVRGIVLFDLLGRLEVGGVLLASDHRSEALGTDSAEQAPGFGVATVVEGVPQVVRLTCAPALVVDDVGPRVDWLPVGSDHVVHRSRVIGGERHVRDPWLELQGLRWRAVQGIRH